MKQTINKVGMEIGPRADLSQANLRWADLSQANLREANLSQANLRWADLSQANLSEANLRWADLSGANLNGANLSQANLSQADLSQANLRWANLRWADLSQANLRWADLSQANLREANLRWANLSEANLRWANLSEANLNGAIGNMKEVKSAQFEGWRITWTYAPNSVHWLQIGCQRHELSRWKTADPRWIAALDSNATEWWAKYGRIVVELVELSPATPWGAGTPVTNETTQSS